MDQRLPSLFPRTLASLMHDGFHALLLLQHGAAPGSADALAEHLVQFLGETERHARQAGLSQDDVWSAKYAFCATADEIILRSDCALRREWEHRPLQLRLFGDGLAGARFFERLAHLRSRGAAHVQALEVFHLCLLLGFRGGQAPDRSAQLQALTIRLGEDLAQMRGHSGAFAPAAARPDHLINKLRKEISPWLLAGLFALCGVGAFALFRSSIDAHCAAMLAQSRVSVSLPPSPQP